MFLTVISVLASLGLSGYLTYLLCIYTDWYYFFVSLLFFMPIWAILFGIWVIILVIWGKFLDKSKEGHYSSFYYWVLRNTDVWLIKILRIFVRKEGFEKVPYDEKCLFIMNHNSNFDPMILIDLIGNAPLICVTKPENMSFPIAGPFVHHSGFIPIDRENPKNALKAIEKASEVISSNTGHICIFPEGTRNKTRESLLPFHPGTFKIATEIGAPIVVIDLKNTKAIKKCCPWRHVTVEANVLAVLHKEDYEGKNVTEISSYCHDMIKDDFEKRRKSR